MFVETDCTIQYDGHSYTAGGALVTPDRAIAYTAIAENIYGMGQGHAYAPWSETGTLQTWHGSPIGTYRVVSSWLTPNSHVSSRSYAIAATIDGRRYYGRTQGYGMIAYLKAYKHQ
jgi:hypothetical protein